MQLQEIHSPADIKKLTVNELPALVDKLRQVLLMKLSRHGGHIGPNLGVVEATVALHYVFDSPHDKIVWDVSHQSYVHKMLTGRMEAFLNPDDYDCVTGYTNVRESPHDFFTVGHTSTSVSLACGLAKARDLQGGHENIIAFIGDGSLSGGEAFEGLDTAGEMTSGMIVVVNDNQMSIAENHGGIYDNLQRLRETNGTDPCNVFKAFGFDYIYIKEGNNVAALVDAFRKVKDINHPVVVHIDTQKGNGYAPAETDRETWHYGAPFDIATGHPLTIDESEDYSDVTYAYLADAMASDRNVVTVTAGTPAVMGFDEERRKKAGQQFVDVGIAEQTAVALASGLARGGAKPFAGFYSTFIQRAYDQVAQDVCINGNAVTIGVFGGGAQSLNDVTHLCWFDIALLSNIPSLVYLAPTCREEYLAMLDWSMKQTEYPVAIRVPGPAVTQRRGDFLFDYSRLNTSEMVHRGHGVAVIAVGNMLDTAIEASRIAAAEGIDITVINPRYLTGLDTAMLDSLAADHNCVITIEDGVVDGGFGQKVSAYYSSTPIEVRNYGLPKEFLDRYDADRLFEQLHMTPKLLAADIKAIIAKQA